MVSFIRLIKMMGILGVVCTLHANFPGHLNLHMKFM